MRFGLGGVGFCPALTGTGAVLVVSALLLLGVPTLTTAVISQLAQLLVAKFGTLGFLLYGELALALGLIPGVLAGLGS